MAVVASAVYARLMAHRRRTGWIVFALSSVACMTALALDLHTGTYRTLAYVGVAEALALMGIVLTTRIPEHRISWVLAISALGWAISNLAFAYAVEALVTDPGKLPGGLAAAWFDNWAWLPGLALPLAAMLLLMPDGRLASRRWWPVPVCVIAGTALGVVGVSSSRTFDLAGTAVANPLAADTFAVAAAGVVGAVLVIGGLVASLVAFAVRYRRSEGDGRQQLRWVGLSLSLAVSLAVTGALLWGVVPGAEILPALASLALPAGIAVAVLRYRLYELDLVVNRAVVYAVMTVAVVGSYVAVVGFVGSYLSRRGDLVVSLVVTAVVAICFQPLRERVQRSVNRLMFGERDDPYTAIAGLSRTLARSLQLDAVLPAAVETIGHTLALQYVALTVPGSGTTPEHSVVAAYRSSTRAPRSASFDWHRDPASSSVRAITAWSPTSHHRSPRLFTRSSSRESCGRHGSGTFSCERKSAGESAATSTTASGLHWPDSRSRSRPSATSPTRTSSVPTSCSSRPPSRCRR
jgi:hypothetical protein